MPSAATEALRRLQRRCNCNCNSHKVDHDVSTRTVCVQNKQLTAVSQAQLKMPSNTRNWHTLLYHEAMFPYYVDISVMRKHISEVTIMFNLCCFQHVDSKLRLDKNPKTTHSTYAHLSFVLTHSTVWSSAEPIVGPIVKVVEVSAQSSLHSGSQQQRIPYVTSQHIFNICCSSDSTHTDTFPVHHLSQNNLVKIPLAVHTHFENWSNMFPRRNLFMQRVCVAEWN